MRFELPGLAVEVGDVELGHGPCRGPGLDRMSRERAAGQAQRGAGSRSDAERATAGDGPGSVRRAHSCILGDTAIWCRAARPAARDDRKATMTDSRSPRFFQSAIADAGPDAARAALLSPRPSIAPKYFYDALGSRLFEAITELDEYYPTRTEAAIFAARGTEMRAAFGTGAILVDLGAGNCAKAREPVSGAGAEALRRHRCLGGVPARSPAPGAEAASAARRGRAGPGLLRRPRSARRVARRRRTALLLSRLEHRQLHPRRGLRLPAPDPCPRRRRQAS